MVMAGNLLWSQVFLSGDVPRLDYVAASHHAAFVARGPWPVAGSWPTRPTAPKVLSAAHSPADSPGPVPPVTSRCIRRRLLQVAGRLGFGRPGQSLLCRHSSNDGAMGHYGNFTVDFPTRLGELDRQFRPLAKSADLEVTYTLMKLAAAFLLPYERLDGDSGARNTDVDPARRQLIRRDLELDGQFSESSYSGGSTEWRLLEVAGFSGGPKRWQGTERAVDRSVREVLEIIRHSVAHSNVFFGGQSAIDHVYLGNRTPSLGPKTYTVLRCSVRELEHLVDCWIQNVQKLRVNPALIWRELKAAA
jgi:hypothetical protein